MRYLVVYPSQTEQAEENNILEDAGQAKEYIEGILQSGNVSEDQISIYEIKQVNFQVARVPVVRITDEVELPKMDIADIPDIITTEEDVAAEQGAVSDSTGANQFVDENDSEKDNIEVFTFEN